MRNKLFIFCALALFFVACNENAPDNGGGNGGTEPQPGFEYKYNAATYTLTFSGPNVPMPNGTWDKKPEWSKYKDITYTVIIEDGITSIGDYAFEYFSELDEVQIANSVKRIGSDAFSHCEKLLKIKLPDNLEVIEDHAFVEDNHLQAPTFPESLDSLGFGSFFNCYTFDKVDLSNTQVKKIPAKCFRACSGIETVLLPPTVIAIHDEAFYGCSKLKQVKVKGYESEDFGLNHLDLTVIGDEAFYLCQKLKNVYLPATLQRLGKRAFANCYELYSVKFYEGNDLTEVGDSTFFSCSALRVLQYNKQCRIISPYMFYKCPELRMLEDLNHVRSIGAHAFEGCTNMVEFPWPTGLETIGASAFAACKELGSIYLYSNVETVGENAFGSCTGVVKLEIRSYYLKRIERSTFYQVNSITEVSLPSQIEYIGEQAFAYCSDLKTIICRSTTPPTLADKNSVFYSGVAGQEVWVPKTALSAYQNNTYWSAYFKGKFVGKDGL